MIHVRRIVVFIEYKRAFTTLWTSTLHPYSTRNIIYNQYNHIAIRTMSRDKLRKNTYDSTCMLHMYSVYNTACMYIQK